MKKETCEKCGSDRVVISQYGINLYALGLNSRFCSEHLRSEVISIQGEDPHTPIGQPLIEETD